MTLRSKLLPWLIILLALSIASCTNPFRPMIRDDINTTVSNRTPKEVLQNLELSYKQRNIGIYEQLLAPDFRFELISSEINVIGIDVNGDGIRDSWWGYEQEIEMTRNLFTRGSSDGVYPPPDQINLRLQIPPETAWENDPEVGHEDWIIIPCVFDLQLLYFASNSSITSSGVARFYLRPVNNRWYIAVWRDESNI